jgi:hypothetical protein
MLLLHTQVSLVDLRFSSLIWCWNTFVVGRPYCGCHGWGWTGWLVCDNATVISYWYKSQLMLLHILSSGPLAMDSSQFSSDVLSGRDQVFM